MSWKDCTMKPSEIIILSSSPLTSPIRRRRQSPRFREAQFKRVSEDFFTINDIGSNDKQAGDQVPSSESSRLLGSVKVSGSFQTSIAVRLNSSPQAPARDSALFDDSLFDDHDLRQEQPTKRRKVSPESPHRHVPSLASKALASIDVFDLSSEPDLVRQAIDCRPEPVIQSDNVSVNHLSDSGDDLPSMADLLVQPRSRKSKISEMTSAQPIELLSDDVDPLNDQITTSPQWHEQHRSGAPMPMSAINTVTNGERKHKKSVSRASDTSAGIGTYAKVSKSTASREMREAKDNILDSSQPAPCKKHKKPYTDKEAETERKRAEKERRAAEKEAEKDQKRLDKERKAIEKQKQADIAEVNKRKTDKKQTVEEMIIDLPKAIKGKSLGNKVEEEIKNLGASFTYYADELDLTSGSSEAKTFGNIIKWRRKINSTYNSHTEEWVPLPAPKTVHEKHILVHVTGEDFGMIATRDAVSTDSSLDPPSEDEMKNNLDTYMTLLRSRFPSYTVIILLDGLQTWLKKHVTVKNREYTAAVRAQPNPYEQPDANAPLASQQSASARPRKRKQTKPDLSFFTSELAEDLLLHLQLTHQPLHIHHAITSHTYREVIAFTQQLSTRPYRAAELDRNLANASFCMASGQFRSGQGDPKETWRLMLEQVNRLTVSMAKGIINEGYDSPGALIAAFEKVERGGTGGRNLDGDDVGTRERKERAKVMLQDVKRSINKVGDCGDKRLGPQISKRLYKVFMSRDPGMRDGIA